MSSDKYVVYAVFAIGLAVFLAGSISPPLAPWLQGPIRIGLAVLGFVVMGGAVVWGQQVMGDQ